MSEHNSRTTLSEVHDRDTEALIALGSNLGERAAYLEAARTSLDQLPQTRLVATSRVMETAPLEFIEQDSFLNQVVKLSTNLEPVQLLDACQAIEDTLGRVRTIPKGPRTIDIDILTFGAILIKTDRLQIPHPALGQRQFLNPLLRDLGYDPGKF